MLRQVPSLAHRHHPLTAISRPHPLLQWQHSEKNKRRRKAPTITAPQDNLALNNLLTGLGPSPGGFMNLAALNHGVAGLDAIWKDLSAISSAQLSPALTLTPGSAAAPGLVPMAGLVGGGGAGRVSNGGSQFVNVGKEGGRGQWGNKGWKWREGRG